MIPVRTAVVGVGHFGSLHAMKHAAEPGADLVAVVDIDASRASQLAAMLNVSAFSSYEALVGIVDAVSIAVPTTLHYKVARFFLDNGIHVLIEKPITSEIAQAEDLIRRAHKNRLVLQVGHLERFLADEMGLLTGIDGPLYIEARRVAPFGMRGAEVSVVLDLMIHDIDLVATIVSAPLENVEAVGASVLSGEDDIVNARLQFENGCTANITASRLGDRSERRLNIFRPDCMYSVNLLKRSVSTIRKPNRRSVVDADARLAVEFETENRVLGEHDALQSEIKAFVAAVSAGTVPVVTGENGLRALTIGKRIIESLRDHADPKRLRPAVEISDMKERMKGFSDQVFE